MMDPTIGRWTTQDPIGLTPEELNRYRYCRDNPTNATDPSGLEDKPIRLTIKLPDYKGKGPGLAKQMVIDCLGEGLAGLDKKTLEELYLNALAAAYIDSQRAANDLEMIIQRAQDRSDGKKVPPDKYLDGIEEKVNKWFGTGFALTPTELVAVGNVGTVVGTPEKLSVDDLVTIRQAYLKITKHVNGGNRLFLRFERVQDPARPTLQATWSVAENKERTPGVILFPALTGIGVKNQMLPSKRDVRWTMYHEVIHFRTGPGDPGSLYPENIAPGVYENRESTPFRRAARLTKAQLLQNPDTYAGFMLDAYYTNPLPDPK